jgi:hypothetical protein
MRLRILESAKDDLIEGYHFYEEQAPGLGTYFLDALFSDMNSLAIYAGIHPKVFGFSPLSKRFPFAIYYQLIDDEARVFAVLDCRRRPSWIRTRLRLA